MRTQFAITHDEDKARRRYPWAKAFIEIKSGIWCFEDPNEALDYRAYRTGGPTPGVNHPEQED